MELPKVRFVFAEFIQEHGLSGLTKPMLAQFLCVSVSSVQKWARAKKIPADYLDTIFAITDEDIRKMGKTKQWCAYDLRVLRTAHSMSQTKMAKKLKACQSSVSKYELIGKIPYHLLPLVQELEKQLTKRQECA